MNTFESGTVDNEKSAFTTGGIALGLVSGFPSVLDMGVGALVFGVIGRAIDNQR